MDFWTVDDMDAVALDTLEEVMKTLAVQEVEVHIAGMKGLMRDVTVRAGWPETFGYKIAHLSLEHALKELGL